MTLESSLIDSALRNWQSNVDRAGKLFGNLSQEQLLQEVAPGKNRLIYLWGHLTAFNDALIPLLAFGSRIHPELDLMFVSNPDRTVPTILLGEDLKIIWQETVRFFGQDSRSCRSPTGCRSMLLCLKRISCGNRIAIGSRFYLAEPCISPITWARQSSRREWNRRT